ncbi:MAG: hypothetical protein EB127_19820 [Alphaproteobacteria bacterium]|nr:hypothetical protein [Alphaproteobacteria bacterium]
MPTYEIKVVGQTERDFIIKDADNEDDAKEIALNQFLDEYAVVISDGSGIPWDLIGPVDSKEIN